MPYSVHWLAWAWSQVPCKLLSYIHLGCTGHDASREVIMMILKYICLLKPRLDDTTCCQPVVKGKCLYTRYNRLSNPLSNRLSSRLYRVYSRLYNPVWQPVERTVAIRSTLLSKRLSNPFDNRLDVCLHDSAGCQTGCTTGLTTGCIV